MIMLISSVVVEKCAENLINIWAKTVSFACKSLRKGGVAKTKVLNFSYLRTHSFFFNVKDGISKFEAGEVKQV